MSATLFRLLDKVGRRRRFGGTGFLFLSSLLPLERACPILILIFIELGFPPTYWRFAGGSCVLFSVTSNAIAVLNVVEKLPLKFAGNQLPVDGYVRSGRLRPTGRDAGVHGQGA